GHETVLDVDLPATPAGAVHAVGGAHDLVELPTAAVDILPGAVLRGHDAVAAREAVLHLAEESQSAQEVTHVLLLFLVRRTSHRLSRTVAQHGISAFLRE